MRYHRLAHLKETPLVKMGAWVHRGDFIGFVGSTGNSSGPHLHYDIRETQAPPPSHTEYIYGWARASVAKRYADPKPYIKDGFPMNNTFPRYGYSYLQWTGKGFHPGVDLNGMNDLGKPVFSPVEGRVVYTLGTTWVKNIFGRLVSKNWNSGWGNMIVIEERPGFKL